MILPDGTSYEPLAWDQLVPYEREQGGYWLYGPWCGVHGEGKVFVRVTQPASQLAIKPVSLADVDYTRYCWGDDLSQLPRTCLTGMPKVPEPAWGARPMTFYEALTGMQLGRGYRVPWHPSACQSAVPGSEACGHAQVWHRGRTRTHPCQVKGCTCLDFVRMWPYPKLDPGGPVTDPAHTAKMTLIGELRSVADPVLASPEGRVVRIDFFSADRKYIGCAPAPADSTVTAPEGAAWWRPVQEVTR